MGVTVAKYYATQNKVSLYLFVKETLSYEMCIMVRIKFTKFIFSGNKHFCFGPILSLVAHKYIHTWV